MSDLWLVFVFMTMWIGIFKMIFTIICLCIFMFVPLLVASYFLLTEPDATHCKCCQTRFTELNPSRGVAMIGMGFCKMCAEQLTGMKYNGR